MSVGDIMIIEFFTENYLKFISHCFSNYLISGVDVRIDNVYAERYILFIRVAAPGIDRLRDTIEQFGGVCADGRLS
jgi:hypothetical protein